MAAEVLAQGGASVTVYDAMPSAGRKFLMAGRGGLNLTHSEALPEFLDALRRGDAASRARDRGISAGCVARLERGAGAADLCRLQRPGVSASVQGLAVAARVAAAARCDGRAIRAAPSLDRLGRRRTVCCFKRRMGNAPSMRARPCWRSAARAGRGSAPTARGSETLAAKGVTISPLRPANCGFTVAWSDIFRDRFEGQPLKGVALSFGPHTRARRGHDHADRHRGRRGLCAVGRVARGYHRDGRGDAARSRCGPISTASDLIARLSAPRGKQSFSNWLRKAAHLSPVGIGLLQEAAIASGVSLSSLSPASSCRIDQRRAGRAQRHRADRARDLDRGRNFVRRTRCRLHDPPLARRVRRRRDAGLGSADRRLSAAGVVRDGRGGGQGCVEVAQASDGEERSEAARLERMQDAHRFDAPTRSSG